MLNVKSVFMIMILWVFTTQVFAEDSFTLYLVRHGEKQTDGNNPSLSRCGRLRALQLAKMLAKVDIEAVYSTYYKRTMETAAPLAQQKSLAIKQYPAKKLAMLVQQLLHKKQNALVVGHSNTTSALADLLLEQRVPKISEQQYQYLFQITVTEQGNYFTLLQQPLTCR